MENSLSLASMLRCLMHILVNADPMSLVPPVEKIKHNKKLFMKKSSSSYLSMPQNSTNVHNTQQYTISSNHVLNIKALLYSASTTTKMLKSVQRQLMLLIKALCAWRSSFLLWKRKKNKLSVIFFYLKKKKHLQAAPNDPGNCGNLQETVKCYKLHHIRVRERDGKPEQEARSRKNVLQAYVSFTQQTFRMSTGGLEDEPLKPQTLRWLTGVLSPWGLGAESPCVKGSSNYTSV